MKFIYTSLLIVLFSFTVKATHSDGGEIFFDDLGGGSYKIHLIVYHDTYIWPNNPTTYDIHTTHALFPTITMNYLQGSPGDITSCNEDYFSFEYIKIVNFGTIPAGGIELYTAIGSSNVVNITTGTNFRTRALILPNPNSNYSSDSPRFHDILNFSATALQTNTLDLGAYDPDSEDSIYVSFSDVIPHNGSLSFTSGYSYTTPFGNSIPTQLDGQTGVMTISNAPIGYFFYGIKITSYRNGVKTAEVERHKKLSIENSWTNNASIYLNNINPTLPYTSNVGNSYYFEMNDMDTLKFDITTFGTLQDSIHLRALGDNLSSNMGYAGNCTGMGCATFTPQNGNYTTFGLNSGTFEFNPDSTFVPAGSDIAFAHFMFEGGIRDSCGVLRYGHIGVAVRINKTNSIWAKNNYLSCNNVPIQAFVHGDNSNLSWSPATGVSNTASASPVLTPNTTTTYTVTNLNNGEQILLTVEKALVSPPSITAAGSFVKIANSKNYDQISWLYNGAIIATGVDSISAVVPGNYTVTVTKGKCSTTSNTYTVLGGNQFPLNKTGSGQTKTIQGNGTTITNFKLQQFGNQLISVTILMPDPFLNKTSSAPVVSVLNGQNQVLATATATQVAQQFWQANGLNINLNANEVYRLKVEGDPGLTVLYEPDTIPYSDSLGIVEITSALYYHNGLPKYGAFPYAVFEFQSGIGINENLIQHKIYPNPIQDVLTIEWEGSGEIQIIDAAGRMIINTTVSGKTRINVGDLPQGVYSYRLWNNKDQQTGILLK